jgi:AcrR family transcriptional regulator
VSRTGRRPGDPNITREEILSAARAAFAESGYEHATLRRIAGAAGVDASLIVHYFGSKAQLFAAAHDLPVDPGQIVSVIGEGAESEIGVRVARLVLGGLAVDGSPAVSLMRAASTYDSAAVMLREFVDRAMISPIAGMIEGPDARGRVALVASHVLGVLFSRYVVGLEEMTSASIDDLVDALGPVFQTALTGETNPPSPSARPASFRGPETSYRAQRTLGSGR